MPAHLIYHHQHTGPVVRHTCPSVAHTCPIIRHTWPSADTPLSVRPHREYRRWLTSTSGRMSVVLRIALNRCACLHISCRWQHMAVVSASSIKSSRVSIKVLLCSAWRKSPLPLSLLPLPNYTPLSCCRWCPGVQSLRTARQCTSPPAPRTAPGTARSPASWSGAPSLCMSIQAGRDITTHFLFDSGAKASRYKKIDTRIMAADNTGGHLHRTGASQASDSLSRPATLTYLSFASSSPGGVPSLAQIAAPPPPRPPPPPPSPASLLLALLLALLMLPSLLHDQL